jgi:perosamine synthetase
MDKFIPIAKPIFLGNEKAYISECIDGGWISSAGKFIEDFERQFADFCNVKYAVAVSNGTVALHLALVALGISNGDEVIVPDLTFAATANSVIYTGAQPVLADVAADSWTIDINRCKDLLTDRTRAIIPVHLYGQPCNMAEVTEFANEHNLFVIEDCAEAHGAKFQGQNIGSFGIINCFSFYGNKIVTTGEGGICLTNEEKLFDRLRVLRDHGMDKYRKYWHNMVGFNYRMTNIQAAVGCGQMEKIDEYLEMRRNIEKYYNERLEHHQLIEIQKNLPDRKKVCWLYSIKILTETAGTTIGKIRDQLKQQNIDSRPFFVPLHQMPPYQTLPRHNLNNSVEISEHGISLPTFSDLKEQEITYIANSLVDILNRE